MITPANLTVETLLPLLMLPFLYAETHYRFKYFFSYLKKNEPEIIADVPHRLETGADLPVLLIVKDAHRYPVHLTGAAVSSGGTELFAVKIAAAINEPYWEHILPVPNNLLIPGSHRISVQISYRTGRKDRVCINDNHRGTAHAPFPVYVSETSLPRIGRCFYGEPHSHSNYTSDQVEFGASLAAGRQLGIALGLDFFAATDHSYDLDDYPDNYLQNDPGLVKWANFRKEVAGLNSRDDRFLVIPGEEVSVRNSAGKNIHCLVYNYPDFIPGSGDGAEKWFRRRSERSLSDILDLNGTDTYVFAAHPFEVPPVLQRLFINRGYWSDSDCRAEKLHGLQLLNGGKDETVPVMINRWSRLLLQGHRLYGLAGNDAHGNFARFRQIHFPFFTMREHYYHLFGKWRTGVYPENGADLTLTTLLKAFGTGNAFMTNGPALRFTQESDGKTGRSALRFQARSTQEFGALRQMRILRGVFGDREENVAAEKVHGGSVFDHVLLLPVPASEQHGYYRCELYTDSGRMAFSNPVWF